MDLGGYVSTEDQGKSGFGQFGLNTGITVLDVSYGELSFGENLNGVTIEYELNGAVKKDNIIDVTKAISNGEDITDPNHKEFKKQQNIWKQRVIHFGEAFATREEVIEAVSQPHSSYESYANAIIDLVTPRLADHTVDLFMQYQWQLKEGADKKFLEIPKKTKMGSWVKASMEGEFFKVEIKDNVITTQFEEGDVLAELELDATGRKPILKLGKKEVSLPTKDTALCYITKDLDLHSFYRTTWFMENGWADSGEEDEVLGGNW